MELKRNSSGEMKDIRRSMEFIEKRNSFEILENTLNKKSDSSNELRGNCTELRDDSVELRDKNNVELRSLDVRVSADDLLYTEHTVGSVSPSEGPKTIGDVFKNLRIRTSSGDILLERWKSVSSDYENLSMQYTEIFFCCKN